MHSVAAVFIRAVLMGLCKKDVTPVHQQWSYVFLALTHRYEISLVVFLHFWPSAQMGCQAGRFGTSYLSSEPWVIMETILSCQYNKACTLAQQSGCIKHPLTGLSKVTGQITPYISICHRLLIADLWPTIKKHWAMYPATFHPAPSYWSKLWQFCPHCQGPHCPVTWFSQESAGNSSCPCHTPCHTTSQIPQQIV